MNDDYTPEQWAQIQANAKAALRRNPRNAAARSALKDANAFLASQREATNVQERADANPPATTPSRAMAIPDPGLRAGIFGAAQGASSGFADEIVGAMQAIRDPTIPLTRQAIDSSIADVRSQMNDVRSANPGSAIAGNVAGAVVNPVNKLLGPLTAGIGPAATGAVYGGTLGGLQGVGEGAPGQRLTSGGMGAVLGGTVGLLLGYGGGKVSGPLGKMWRNLRNAFIKTEQQVTRAVGPTAAPEAAQAAKEAAHRAYLNKEGYPPEVIDRLMATWSTKGKLPPNPPVVTAPPADVPVRIRPGETLVQKGLREFEVTGTRATPAPPTTPTILEMQTGQKLYPVGPAQPRPQDEAARNAYNYVQGLGAPDALATDASRRAAGHATNMENFDPRQALVLAMLLGAGQQR